jgi:succinoglycan biosynthesis transport protein ExoP
MALALITPRDRLQRLVDLALKTLRYWWLILLLATLGGALSVAFAMTRPKVYQSWAVLFYQERIQSSLFSGREEQGARNIGDRYRELLLARGQLEQIVNDPKLNAFAEAKDTDTAIDKLRLAIRFDPRGANAFRITYTDNNADRAKAVTEKLTKLLQEKDEALRNEQAQATATFAQTQKEQAATELEKREHELAEFLARHPEFAQDPNTGEGASIRAIHNAKTPTPVVATGDQRLYALQRQRQRIQARLDAPADAAPQVHIVGPATPEKLAAEALVNDAEREVTAAQRELEDASSKYTEKHPTVIKAQERVAAAQQRLRHAQASVPADVEAPVAPASAEDRAKLEKDLATLDYQISAEQKAAAAKPGDAAAQAAAATNDASTSSIVQLETQNADLRRAVAEQRERVASLADSVFRAQMDASQKLAEQGGRLTVVDPPFKPGLTTGPGKAILVMAGVVLFFAIGLALALGLALIDDRIYRRSDIELMGLVPVLAVIPPLGGAAGARAVRRSRATTLQTRRRDTAATQPSKPLDEDAA